jgi:putative sporulation protein YtaF
VQVVILFVLAIATSIDSLGVGVAYGLNGTRVRFSAHVCICIVMLAITWASVAAGNTISRYLPDIVTNLLSAAFFIGVGLWILVPAIRKRRRKGLGNDRKAPPTVGQVLADPQLADMDYSRNIDIREALLLGVALSLNNIGGGISAGMIRISAAAMAFLSVFFNVLCLTSGHAMGKRLSDTRVSANAELISGTLLILVGLWQLH